MYFHQKCKLVKFQKICENGVTPSLMQFLSLILGGSHLKIISGVYFHQKIKIEKVQKICENGVNTP